MRPIGYYVHHQGDGHLQRALAIAANAPERIVLMGTGLAGRTRDVRCIDLPDDRASGPDFSGQDGARTRPLALHYAPLDHDGVRRRMSLVAQWIALENPALVVVDVSVEMAMLARLCATPVVYVRLSGRRDDAAHLEAFRLSEALLAPFDSRLDDPDVAGWVRDKTVYCAGIVTPAVQPVSRVSGVILVVVGKGGRAADGDAVAAAARSLPDRKWRVIGPCTPPRNCPDNLDIAGWVDDPAAEIARAGVVVGGAGDGLVGHVIAAPRPFICIPEDRPHDEQRQKARALERNRAAVVLDGWPVAESWPVHLASAKARDVDRLKELGDPHGADKAYRCIEAIADRESPSLLP